MVSHRYALSRWLIELFHRSFPESQVPFLHPGIHLAPLRVLQRENPRSDAQGMLKALKRIEPVVIAVDQ
jgi:hypothetical protein